MRFRSPHKFVQNQLEFMTSITETMLCTAIAGHGHIFVGDARNIDLDALGVVHDVVALGIVCEVLRFKQNVQPFAAGAAFGIAVHQIYDLSGDQAVGAAVINAQSHSTL